MFLLKRILIKFTKDIAWDPDAYFVEITVGGTTSGLGLDGQNISWCIKNDVAEKTLVAIDDHVFYFIRRPNGKITIHRNGNRATVRQDQYCIHTIGWYCEN